MYFEGKSFAIVDATTGYIIDESRIKTSILNISYFLSLGRVLVEMERNKSLYVLNINLDDIPKSWLAEVGPVQKMMFGLASRASTVNPTITQDGSTIIVDNEKNTSKTSKS